MHIWCIYPLYLSFTWGYANVIDHYGWVLASSWIINCNDPLGQSTNYPLWNEWSNSSCHLVLLLNKELNIRHLPCIIWRIMEHLFCLLTFHLLWPIRNHYVRYLSLWSLVAYYFSLWSQTLCMYILLFLPLIEETAIRLTTSWRQPLLQILIKMPLILELAFH